MIKMKHLLFFTILISFFVTLEAQQNNKWMTPVDLNHFDGLKSEGPTPMDLRLSLDQLYTLDKQRVRDYADGKLPNSDKVLRASYHINKLMTSGRILYGDPVTRLIERIADTLLADYPQLRSELRFYTIKSPEVNAFATGQGMVFVCTGLVAQVEDEAQLAFVISHEIIHYLRKHSLETITRRKHDSDDIDAETQEMRDFIKYHNRSHQMENEADSLGLTLFYLDSPYDKGVAEGFFDVLQYGYLPFDEIPFDTTYFNTPYYKMPRECFLDSLAPITARDDYDDSLSTHPNILKRRTLTASVVGDRTGGARFVMSSPAEFEAIRNLARLECVRQDLIHAEYARAFYDCYLLQRLLPDNDYVERALCQALYGLSKHKTYANNSSAVGNYKDFEGEVQQSYYFFRQVKREDLALITARRLWRSHQRHPDDEQIAAMCADIFADLYEKYGFTPSYFATTYEASQPDTTSANASKYQRLKQKKNKQNATTDKRTLAFTDMLQDDPAFGTYLESHLRNHETAESSLRPNQKQLIYNPRYFVASSMPFQVKYRQSDRQEHRLCNQIAQAAAANGIRSENFSDQSLQNTLTAERYNQFVDIVEWVNEYWNTEGNFDMLNSMQPAMDRISSQYDVQSINMTRVLNLEQLGHGFKSASLYLMFIPPLIPTIFENMISSSEATVVHTVQIDALTGHTIKKSTSTINYADEKARVTNTLYDHFRTAIDSTRTTPGFMGSHFIISAAPTLGITTQAKASGSMSSNLSFNVGAQLSAAAVVSRSKMIELSASYLPLQYNENVKSSLFSAFLNYRMMSKKQPAPLGRSAAFGLGLGDYRLADDVDGLERDNLFLGVHFDISRNYVVAPHIALGYSLLYNIFIDQHIFADDVSLSILSSSILRIGLTLSFIP